MQMEDTPIRTADEHRQALQQIERLWHAAPGSSDEVRLEKLVAAVEAYEARRFSGWEEEQTQG
jgi:HTH-type transcriptional regulator/antitoxin HigA